MPQSASFAVPGPEPAAGRLLVVNLVFVAVVVLYLLASLLGTETAQPLVQADQPTARRIERLEQNLQRNPASLESAVELATIYRDAGEHPWSYDALQNAERTGTREVGWRLRLGLAYLQLGKTDDALRVLGQASKSCAARRGDCPAEVQIKLDLFGQVARLFKKRGIDPNKQRMAADQALQEVLKPVQVDPAKMRPKAPAAPPAAPAPRPAETPSRPTR